jgi:hypothetical protein
VIRAAESRLEGRCSRDKALFLARTVLAEHPQVTAVRFAEARFCESLGDSSDFVDSLLGRI